MPDPTKSRLTVDLADRVALVTGAGRGLGRAIAETLAANGAKVACLDINPDLLAETVGAITTAGGAAAPFPCNVTDSEGVTGTVAQVVKHFGGLDIVVNNAGITRDTLLMRMKDDQWDTVLAINLRGTFLVTRAAARPLMKSKAGRIVNIASVSGIMGNPGQANYSASKAGVIGLTRTVAKELASRQVTVNAIAPGFIATEMTAKLGEELLEQIRGQVPLGRLGDPQDIADAVVYLASDAGRYISGQVLTVDGGLT